MLNVIAHQEMQIKAMMIYHSIPLKEQKKFKEKTTNMKFWVKYSAEYQEFLFIAGGIAN